MTEFSKISNFRRLYAFFPKFSTDFVDWNVKKGQQRKNVLSSRLFRRVYCSFPNENDLKFTPKMTKNKIFSNFQSFYAFFVKVSTDLVDWCFKGSTTPKSTNSVYVECLHKNSSGIISYKLLNATHDSEFCSKVECGCQCFTQRVLHENIYAKNNHKTSSHSLDKDVQAQSGE